MYDARIMPKPAPKKHLSAKEGESAGGRVTVSIHDVASAARVSIATVSRVINNPHLVSARTAARVQEVIRKTGYAPNPFAQGLITRSSRVLGIALPDIHGEFYSELLRGADAEARSLGYHLLVSSEPRREDRGPANGSLAFGLIDGIAVMITDAASNLLKEAKGSLLPTVVLDTDLHAKGVDSLVVDNAGGTREGVNHLLASVPASSLYFVGGPEENFDAQQRASAFRAAVAASGWKPRADQVSFGDYTSEWGERWAEEHLKATGKGVFGVLAGNDEIAIGVMQAASQAGVRIPDQLRLVGFDDTRLATLIRPRLSTVRVPMAEVGAASIRLLVRRIEDREAEITCVHLPTSLVVRESSVPRA
ncbi:Catabolite control protein A [Phycisphaerales bacterium]|nr:Catabolite control protein A [Phycisphaerales bacterium]